MEVKIIFKVSDIDNSINFYVNILGLFKLKYKDSNGKYCDLYNDNLTLHLTTINSEYKANIFFMEVNNSYVLFNHFNENIVLENHIVRDYKKYKGKDVDFLMSPIGDSFSIEDLDKNRIIFFDIPS